jgi:hypothetical protein
MCQEIFAVKPMDLTGLEFITLLIEERMLVKDEQLCPRNALLRRWALGRRVVGIFEPVLLEVC